LAAPSNQTVLQWVIPPGKAEIQYSPQALAWDVKNYEITYDATLRTVRLPSPYQINTDTLTTTEHQKTHHPGEVPQVLVGAPEIIDGIPTGVFHANMFGGISSMLLVSTAGSLWMHQGWSSSLDGDGRHTHFIKIDDSLTKQKMPSPSVSGQRFPDQFVLVNDLVIYTNGEDQARVIRPDGEVFKLGFSEQPSTPHAEGPSGLDIEGRDTYYPNSHGYSWEGKIGTAGDMLSSDGGGVLAGHWMYYCQYEDQFGNLSATSAPSNAVRIEPQTAHPLRGDVNGLEGVFSEIEHTLGTEIKDVMRQFLVRLSLPKGDHDAVAVRLYRTPDVDNVGSTPRFVDRIPIGHDCMYPDNIADAELGDDMVSSVPVPVFKVMCVHQGRLIIGNIGGAPGMVRQSQPGFPGTFSQIDFVFPDSGGAEITGLTSFNGTLIAFTERSVYSLDDFGNPGPLSAGIGCVAPNSIQPTRDGSLMWLSHDGFYSFDGQAITKVSIPIDRTIKKKLNNSRLRFATATIDPDSGEYRCAVAPAGTAAQHLVLCFDGTYWRTLDYRMHIADWTTTKDWRDLSLFVGLDATATDVSRTKTFLPTGTGVLGPVGSGGFVVGLESEGDDAEFTAGVPYIGGVEFSGGPTENNIEIQEYLLYRGTSVYVTNRETSSGVRGSNAYQTTSYRSGWLRGDQNALTPVNVRTMYIGMVDTEDSIMTIKLYKDGSAEPTSVMEVKTVGLDNNTGIVSSAGNAAVMGSSKAQLPRVYWRTIPVNLNNVHTWCFEIESVVNREGGLVELSAFAFDVSQATGGNVRARIPQRSDV
jgi:hypothetical protein